jgi:hypothetical protein
MNITEKIDEIIRTRKALLPRINDCAERTTKLRDAANWLFELAEELRVVGLRDIPEAIAIMRPRLEQLQEDWNVLHQRFSRDNLTLLTFGKARSGKSRTLITLTGLPENELISRTGDHCTGTIVEVVHGPGPDRRYSVQTYSKEDFFRDKVLPYLEFLGIHKAPKSLAQFKKMSLPELDKAASVCETQMELTEIQKGTYQHLLLLHQTLPRLEKFLTGEDQPIKLDEVEAWTTYPDAAATEPDWRCLAVRSTTLETNMPLPEFHRVRLFDTPGLGSHRVGELESLAAQIDFEADAVLRIDRPDGVGVGQERVDSEYHDAIESRLRTGVKLHDIQFVVINKLDIISPNEKTAPIAMRNWIRRGIPADKIVIADCSKRDDLHSKVISPLLDRLVKTTPAVDEARISAAMKRLDKENQELSMIFQRLRAKLDAVVELQDHDELFDTWYEQSQKEFRKEFLALKKESLAQREAPDDHFLREIDRVKAKAEQEVPVVSPAEIMAMQERALHEFGGTLDHFVVKLRYQIGAAFGEICSDLGRVVIGQWQLQLKETLEKTGVLRLLPIMEDSKQTFLELSALFDASGYCPQLTYACRLIADFEIRHPQFLYAMWFALHRLHPDNFLSKLGDITRSEQNQSTAAVGPQAGLANHLSTVLATEKQKAIDEIACKLREIATLPSNVCWGLIWDAHDRMVLTPEAQKEWKRFLRKHSTRLLPERPPEEQELLFAVQQFCTPPSSIERDLWDPPIIKR